MWTVDMVGLICPEGHCDKTVEVLVKWNNGDGYFIQEAYCKKHGEKKRKALKAQWERNGWKYQDKT